MNRIPRERSLDSTLALMSEGYTFISSRCARLGTDVFETRLMLRKAFCAMGAEAAEIFYGGDRFTRQGAMPPTVLRLLQDKGSVQLLDGEDHRRRKRMFMAMMASESVDALAAEMSVQWRKQVERWKSRRRIVLHHEVQEILCRAVCMWAGLPPAEEHVAHRTRELAAMMDAAGSVGPRNWRAQRLRERSERWARDVVRRVRAGVLEVPEGSALAIITAHRDGDGAPLDAKVAAAELLNVLRPTVAVARYITFAALALHEHPESRARLRAGDEAHLIDFVHEVRRHYPFFPAVGGRVREPFDWRGRHFKEGSWMLFDLYGTNHDPRIWTAPAVFHPDRFRTWDKGAFNYVPQGGGDTYLGHRCPGEDLTIELMKHAVRLLMAMSYDVPRQDLRVDLSRMPAIPASRFVMTNIRWRETFDLSAGPPARARTAGSEGARRELEG